MEQPSFVPVLNEPEQSGKTKTIAPKKTVNFPSYSVSGAMTKRMKRFLSNRIFKFERAVTHLLSHASARAYGTIFLSFGLLSLILLFVGLSADRGISTSVIALVFTLLAIPLLVSDKSLPAIIQSFSLTDFIFFELFFMKRTDKTEKDVNPPALILILIGVAAALLGCIVPIWQVVLTVGLGVFVYLSFVSPEFVFFVSFLVLPYSSYIPKSEILFPIIVGLTVVSFVRKVIYGKRVITLEKYDLVLGLMLLFVLISGIFVKGVESFSSSVEMVVMAMGYVLAGNIIANRRLADRVINSLIISSTLPAIISIVQLVRVILSFMDGASFLSGLNGVLARDDGVALYLLAAVIFSISMAKHSSGFKRAVYVFAMVVNLLALIISCEIFAIIALILSGIAHQVLRTNKKVWFYIPVLMALPYLLFLLPNVYLDKIFFYVPSLGTANGITEMWRKCISALGSNILFGIGIGQDSFITEMSKYGIEGFVDSSNMFIELGLEAGIFALLCFIILLVVRFRHRRGYFAYMRSSQVSADILVSEVCLFAFITFGCMNYIWSDVSAYYLFWTVFGIGSATIRVAKKEHDDRVFYYEDSMSLDSSALDVEIG